MDDRLYRTLKLTAILLTAAWLGWALYDGYVRHSPLGDDEYFAANKLFEDGQYARALKEYEAALQQSPKHIFALRGKAQSLMQLGRFDEAVQVLNTVIRRDPGFAASYANRGVLYDRMGQYRKAIADYEHALRLDDTLDDGPNWLTRFLRLQSKKPPTIGARARYLREQLAKPEAERHLRAPAEDRKQRPYQM